MNIRNIIYNFILSFVLQLSVPVMFRLFSAYIISRNDNNLLGKLIAVLVWKYFFLVKFVISNIHEISIVSNRTLSYKGNKVRSYPAFQVWSSRLKSSNFIQTLLSSATILKSFVATPDRFVATCFVQVYGLMFSLFYT